MFDAIKAGLRKALDVFKPRNITAEDRTPARNELRLLSDEYQVKRKLGRSFFTRQLRPNVRAARIAMLTDTEHAIARSKGWL